MSTQPGGNGVYFGPLQTEYLPLGHCVITFRLGTFDTPDDADNLPEQRVPIGASLTLTPNINKPVILPDGTIMVIKEATFKSNDGTFDFWAIDGKNASVYPNGWDWTAVLKIDGSTQLKFTFSPDSKSSKPLNLGSMLLQSQI